MLFAFGVAPVFAGALGDPMCCWESSISNFRLVAVEAAGSVTGPIVQERDARHRDRASYGYKIDRVQHSDSECVGAIHHLPGACDITFG